MRNGLLLASILFVGATLGSADRMYGQEEAKQNGQKAQSTRQQKAPSKPHKVWTEDDLGTIRNRGDITVAAAQNPTMPATADASPSPASPVKTTPVAQRTGKAALSNPKTTEEAEGMIAWEQRDIDSQQEYVDRLQTELEQAPPEEREHLQKVIADRQQILADTRREQQQLIAQKKTLEKKSASGENVASATQP